MSISETLTALGNACRSLFGISSKHTLAQWTERLNAISKQGAKTVTPSTSEQTAVPSGVYTTGEVKVAAMPGATQATPSISVSAAGLITASATQGAGYVAEGTKSATHQLATQAAKTVAPSIENQTAVASGVFTTGAVTVQGISSFYHDGYTRFYMHGNSLSDQSGNGKSISNAGTSITTATSKFGGKSIRVPTNSNIYTGNALSGGGAFTVEMWVYLNHKDGNANNLHCLWSHGGSNAAARTGGILVWGGNGFGWYNSGWIFTTNANFPAYQWHHVAFVGDGSSIKLYVNGVLQCTSNGAYNLSTSGERFGMNDSDYSYNGSSDYYIQGIRLSNCARYTGNFTPPTQSFVVTYR